MPLIFRRPVLSSLVIAVALTAAVLAYGLSSASNVDEKPFILYFTVIAFPFVWLALWVVLGGIAAWWRTLGGE